MRPRRSTATMRVGLARAKGIAKRLGIALREARQAAGLTQAALAGRAGVSQPEIARLEAGQGWDTGIDTWAACAAGVGLQLAAFLERAPGADLPRDLEHLRRQNLVIAASAPGGWRAFPEALIPDGTAHPRSIDVLLVRDRRREAAVVEIWDLILDGGAAMRGLEGKVLAARQRWDQGWNVQGLLLVRGTRRNRALVAGLGALFTARYPASSDAWLRALRDPATPLPSAAGLAWTDVQGSHLIAARLRAPAG